MRVFVTTLPMLSHASAHVSCHRVGQTQTVEVIRLIAADSVEEDMQRKVNSLVILLE